MTRTALALVLLLTACGDNIAPPDAPPPDASCRAQTWRDAYTSWELDHCAYIRRCHPTQLSFPDDASCAETWVSIFWCFGRDGWCSSPFPAGHCDALDQCAADMRALSCDAVDVPLSCDAALIADRMAP